MEKWMEIARGEIGQHEIKGGENPRILEYHACTTLKAREDEIPWCAAFVCWCLEKSGITSTKSAAASSYLGYGTKLVKPVEGCICVLRQRKAGLDSATGSSSGKHVGFWLSQDSERVKLLGGNQSDSVKESSFGLASYEVLAYVWPLTNKPL